MHIVDHIFMLLLFIAMPIHGAWAYRRYVARIEAGEAPNRVRLYKETLALEWVGFAVLMATWYWLGRPIADLGFVPPEGNAFWIGVGVLALATAYLIYSWRATIKMSNDERDKQIDALGSLVHFLPRDKRDYRYFFGLSITAGIVEETIYRGFVIWYLTLFMPVWAAVIISSIAFGLGHTYQGTNGVVRVAVIGLVFGAFYVLTGSIWLAIVGHAILDILQGALLLELLGRRR